MSTYARTTDQTRTIALADLQVGDVVQSISGHVFPFLFTVAQVRHVRVNSRRTVTTVFYEHGGLSTPRPNTEPVEIV